MTAVVVVTTDGTLCICGVQNVIKIPNCYAPDASCAPKLVFSEGSATDLTVGAYDAPQTS